jgi:hypothetical protein
MSRLKTLHMPTFLSTLLIDIVLLARASSSLNGLNDVSEHDVVHNNT